jgi:hypothetical protein
MPLGYYPNYFAISGRQMYIADGDNLKMDIINLSGMEVPAATINTLKVGSIDARNDVISYGRLQALNGASIEGGIYVQGVGSYSTYSTTSLEQLPVINGNITDARNSYSSNILELVHSVYGNALDGIGASVLFSVEDSSGRATSTSKISSILTDATTATPKSALVFETKNSVDGLSEKVRIDADGNVGIGTSTPATALDVNGIIKTQPTSARTCNISAEGGIMYNSSDNHFYGCNGVSWVQLDN